MKQRSEEHLLSLVVGTMLSPSRQRRGYRRFFKTGRCVGPNAVENEVNLRIDEPVHIRRIANIRMPV